MIRAIDDYIISGVETTLPFCKFTLQHDAFKSGNFDTHFVGTHFTPEKLLNSFPGLEEVAALFAVKAYEENEQKLSVGADKNVVSKWKLRRN